MTWIQMIKNDIKLLKFKEKMVVLKIIGRQKFIYWIEYKFLYVLIHIIDLKLIAIKTC